MKKYDFEDSPFLSAITQEVRVLFLQAVHVLSERFAPRLRPLRAEELNRVARARVVHPLSETKWSSRPTSAPTSARL